VPALAYQSETPTPFIDALLERDERARHDRIAQQMQEASARRFRNPDPIDRSLLLVWVAYQWNNKKGRWELAGFLRRRPKRRKHRSMNKLFAWVRRKLSIDRHIEVRLMDLGHAQRALKQGRFSPWLYEPPRRVESTAPAIVVTTKVPKRAKVSITRYRKSVAPVFHKRHTKFVAFGRHTWDRTPSYQFTYLGPVDSTSVNTRYPTYNDILVVSVSALSKRLRNAMHTARSIKPGVSTIVWPEPMARSVLLALPKSRLKDVSVRDAQVMVKDVETRLARLARSSKDRDEKIAAQMALLSFLYTLPNTPS
jgi:hypothetical protein